MKDQIKDQMNWYLIRGLGRGTAHWGDFPDRLRQAFPGCEVHGIDLPGNGRFFRETSPLRLTQMTDFARRKESIGKRRAGSKSYFIGLSLGAMVMIDWLTRFPSDADGGVMINTSLGKWAPFYQRLKPGAMIKLAQIFRAKTVRERELRVLEMTSNRTEIFDSKASEWAEIYLRYPVSRQNTVRQLLAAARFVPPGKPPRHPLLVLTSRCDNMVDTRCSEEIARHWDLPKESHPVAGHDIPLDDPEWTLSRIRDWVLKQP